VQHLAYLQENTQAQVRVHRRSISPSRLGLSDINRRLQELEEETAALKQQLQSSGPNITTGRELVSLRSADDNSIVASGSLLPFSANNQPSSNLDDFPINALSEESTLQPRPTIRSNDPSVSRSLDGLELEPSMIDDCFTL
jgi:hypothetical protein